MRLDGGDGFIDDFYTQSLKISYENNCFNILKKV